MPFDVVGVGLNAIDYLCRVPRFPVRGEKLRMTGFSRSGGGQVATALVALARWGLRAMYVGNVGEDGHGRLSLDLLRQEGIDVSRARTVPGAASQFAVILVEEATGERTIVWDRDVRLRIRPDDLPLSDIRAARALLVDGHDVPASVAAARAARSAGVPVVLDAEKVQEGTEELLGLCGHIVAAERFPGRLFGPLDPGEAARRLRDRFGAEAATVTLGARGAVGCDAAGLHRAPAPPVDAVDTTGAGDVFHAGYLFALLGGRPFPEVLAFANAAAALSCRALGGRSAIPLLGEIAGASASARGTEEEGDGAR